MILSAQEVYNNVISPISIHDVYADELTVIPSRCVSMDTVVEEFHIHISKPISIYDILNKSYEGFTQYLANILSKYAYHQSVIINLYITNYERGEYPEEGEAPLTISPIPLTVSLHKDTNGVALIHFTDPQGNEVTSGYLSGDIYLHKAYEPVE